MSWKTFIKRNILKVLMPFSHQIQIIFLQNWFIKHLSSKFLDPQVVPKELVPKPLWKTSYHILCNPYAFTHRRPYWFGRLHEIHVERYMRRNLKPGDTFIDVGCNCGHHTTLGASLVGSTGRVIAFEPNKKLATRVQEHISNEGLKQVLLHSVGLGKESCSSLLYEQDPAYGMSKIDIYEKINKSINTDSVECEVRVADEIINPNELKGKVLLKVDVEGLEIEVLSGMQQILYSIDYAIVEITPDWLQGEKGSQQIFTLMSNAKLHGYELLQNGSIGKAITPSEIHTQTDVLFLRQT